MTKRHLIACWLPLSFGFLLLILAMSEAKEKKQPPEEPYALLMITCVSERGLSLPATSIEVQMLTEPEQKPGKSKWARTSDVRGESAFRLPAGKNSFSVKASRQGYQPQEKKVTFSADERQDLLFTMQPLATRR
jgi:hypothetical protein